MALINNSNDAAVLTSSLYNAANSAISVSNAVNSKKMQRETNRLNKQMFDEQLAWNRKQWEDTNAYNLKLWEMQNEYNTPYNQMQRLKAAGLNPNLVYGSGATTLATSPSSASMVSAPSAPRMQGEGFLMEHVNSSSLIQAMQSNALFRSELESRELDNQAKRNGLSLFGIDQSIRTYELIKKMADASKGTSEANVWSDIQSEYLEKLRNEAKGQGLKNDLLSQEFNYNEIANPLKLSHLTEKLNNMRLTNRVLLPAQVSNLYASVANLYSLVDLHNKQGNLVDEQVYGASLKNSIEEINLELKEYGIPYDKFDRVVTTIGKSIGVADAGVELIQGLIPGYKLVKGLLKVVDKK